MTMAEYTPPVDQLLPLGAVEFGKEWRNYLDLGLTREHVPELLRLMTDPHLNFEVMDGPELWGPIHAWLRPDRRVN